MFGRSAAAAVADPDAAIAHLRGLASEGGGAVTLRADGSEVSVGEEADRLHTARVTGKTPRDGYDIELLASTGKRGLHGHMEQCVRRGERIRITPRSAGFRLPGIAVILAWVLEFVVLAGMAFRRVD
jgi:hypothetical protein